MKRQPHDFLPKARKQGMVIKEVDNEVLIYDLERDKAHCLNPSAAAIWRRCDGQTNMSALAGALANETSTTSDEDFIWLGLQDLHRNGLLEDGVWPDEIPMNKSITRREAVRRIGLGAAIALPIVISITAPTPVQAAVSCSARCRSCSTGSECCSGVCANESFGLRIG